MIIYALLHGGALVNESLSHLNPTTAHLLPKRLLQPSTYILKILLAAGCELENELFIPDENL